MRYFAAVVGFDKLALETSLDSESLTKYRQPTVFSNITLVSELQSQNAEFPILTIPEGIVIFVSEEHPENAELAIPTVSLLNVTEVAEESQSITHLST